MAKQESVAGLDMGSGRVTCLIGTPNADNQRMKILGGASVPCRGIKGGVVINIHETARAVTQAVEEAEAAAKQMVASLYMGVRGNHLQSFNNRGAFNIARTDKEITAEDINSVVANAKAIPLSSDREILHVVPQGFSLDRQRGVPHPVGMEGSLLEVDVHIVTASTAHLNNIIKTVAQAGFSVIEPIYGLLAVGEVLVTPEEKDLGCLLIDFGGQSISLGIYSEGSIRYSKELAIGSDFITRDLAVGLRTSLAAAEKIKMEHAVAHPALLNGDNEIDFHGVDGRSLQKVKTSAMMGIILPRVEEIFSLIADDLQNSSYADLVVSGGAVITGGGSLMRGTTAAAEQILGMPVRVGMAHPDFFEAESPWLNPTYATALGLLHFSRQVRWGCGLNRFISRKKPMWLRRITSVFEDIF
ncbi:MAG: cell division protein FtsA [Elusimicrobia bacterium RIFCSPHIGHO2_02_FULL_57_9]|nr:MAG: cell division protein FtsA [Elusimicrobia bacterium RIFCSPHIGHO2_02_FULL_57_9]